MQLAHRLTSQFLHQTLDAFNRGELDPDTAAQLLSVSRLTSFACEPPGFNNRPLSPSTSLAATIAPTGPPRSSSSCKPSCRSNDRPTINSSPTS